MSQERVILRPAQIIVRHVKRGASTDAGAVQVLDSWLVPQDVAGLNGKQGWQSGWYAPRMGEFGSFELRLPNGPGSDGVLHRKRLLINTDPEYKPGDEWFEFYETQGGVIDGDPDFVGTPTKRNISRSEIVLSGYCGLWLQNNEREKAAGFHIAAPRDIFELYSRRWMYLIADDMTARGRFTYSASEQTSGDSKYVYKKTEEVTAGQIRLRTSSGAVGSREAYIEANAELTQSIRQWEAWRAELVYHRSLFDSNDSLKLAVGTAGGASPKAYIEIKSDSMFFDTYFGGTFFYRDTGVGGPQSIAIECRGAWTYFFYNGELLYVLPTDTPFYSGLHVRAELNAGGTGSEITADIESLTFETLKPFLMNQPGPSDTTDTGDLRLPGVPAGTGFAGEYFDNQPEQSKWGTTMFRHELPPTKEPYARRVDPVINFPTVGPPAAWQPVGPADGVYFGARWVGAIYLDLTNYDYAFRITCDDRARLWVGSTLQIYAHRVIDDWTQAGHAMTTTTSTWMKNGTTTPPTAPGASQNGILRGQTAGWFPIILEYANGAGGGGITFEYTRSDNPTLWSLVNDRSYPVFGSPAASQVKVAPIGVEQKHVRFDSFYEQLQAVRETWGYQFMTHPRSLESGRFPGVLQPRVRLGRDTDYVIDEHGGIDAQSQVSAEDTCDALLLDAQGLADPKGAAQVTKEAINFDKIDDHLIVARGYDSLADISIPELAAQRALALLALKTSSLEDVGVRPEGQEQLVDSFPVTGVGAAFKWQPGDGVRLDQPSIDVVDLTPRQITGARWPVYPDGKGRPEVTFRQRPKGLGTLLRQALRRAITPQRTYQKQIVLVHGNVAFLPTQTNRDDFSRISAPINIEDIISVTLVVQHRYGTTTTPWAVAVNAGANTISVNAPGRYDVTHLAVRNSTEKRIYATATGGTGNIELALEALVRV